MFSSIILRRDPVTSDCCMWVSTLTPEWFFHMAFSGSDDTKLFQSFGAQFPRAHFGTVGLSLFQTQKFSEADQVAAIGVRRLNALSVSSSRG